MGNRAQTFSGNLLHLLRCCAAEFIGTTLLLYTACASSSMGALGGAIASGLTVTVLVAGLADISGGHINPAVTVGLTITGNCEALRCLLYIPTQLIGAFAGSLLYRATVDDFHYQAVSGGINSLNATLTTPGQAFIGETILMYSFLSVILLTKGLNLLAPVYIGAYVIIGILNNGITSGASMNPARSLGPACAFAIFGSPKKAFAHHWIYWAGPMLGSTLAALTFKLLMGGEDERWSFARQPFARIFTEPMHKHSLAVFQHPPEHPRYKQSISIAARQHPDQPF